MPLCSGDPTPSCPPMILHLPSGKGSSIPEEWHSTFGGWISPGIHAFLSAPYTVPSPKANEAPAHFQPSPLRFYEALSPSMALVEQRGPSGSLYWNSSQTEVSWVVSKIPIRIFSVWEYFSLEREAAILFETLYSVSSIEGKTDIMMLGQGMGTSNSSLNVNEEHIIWV